LPESSKASVVFKPGKKPEYVGPGGVEEELSGDAVDLFQIGQAAEKEGNYKRAVRAYKSLVKRHPKDKVAPEALYRAAQLQEQEHLFFPAADSFSQLVERYPGSAHFEQAIEAQFRIGEIYLNGKKLKVLGIPIASALDRAVAVFANVVRTAPYGKYTARAQFDIGLAREKQGANDAAIQAYQAVVDKFPSEPLAVDAQYQIGYIWFTAAQLGTKDAAARPQQRTRKLRLKISSSIILRVRKQPRRAPISKFSSTSRRLTLTRSPNFTTSKNIIAPRLSTTTK